MGANRYRIVVALLVLALFASASLSPAGLSAQQQGPPIRLKAATFAPTRGEAPAIPPGLALRGYAEGQRGYYLVQFSGAIEQAWKDELIAAGAEILAYVPDFAFKVRMTPAEARQVERLASVGWVGLFHPAFKLSPDLVRDGMHVYTVRVERGADAGLAAAAIARSGATILGREEQMLMVGADAAQLDAMAQVLDVAWVQNFLLPEKHDKYGAGVIMGSNTANASGYDGSTQTVAVADTGLGGGTAETAHPDIPKERVTAIYNWPGTTDICFSKINDDGAIDVDSGHGTHVSGSVLGGGDANGEGRGTAPAANLVFQATENWVTTSGFCKTFYGYADGYYLTGLPADLHALFQQAYDQGARVHSNSWGSAAAGDYTANSANADDFIWTHRDMTITFSAGNEGADANNDGVVDSDSIGSPATAKNVITVGASENDREGNYPCDRGLGYASDDGYQNGQTCVQMNGTNLLGTGSRWSFKAEPLASDPTAGNKEQMALFSSRGPTDDGRIKPDVVAPGTWLLSGYSGLYQQGYGDPANPQNGAYQWDGWGMPFNSTYKWMGGTSMSNPLVAGAAAVVRDFYQKAHSLPASAALVKATLINSAVDMLDENNDGANDNDFPIPNVHEGWGRVNVAAATDGSHKFVEQTAGLATNGTMKYQASVSAAGPLKVTLVWSDYASTETATKNLVNDLDLVVTSPSGTVVYRGNVFTGGWSTTGGTADRTNNVENVYIQSAATGTWTVEVKGFNVPNGPQPFALVVGGAASVTEGTPPPPPPTVPAAPSNLTATAVSSSQINLTWADNSGDETGFKIERSTGGSAFAQVATVGANVTTYSNTGLAGGTTYYYRVRATNANGDSAYSNTASATTTAASTPAAPSGLTATAASTTQINLSWADNSGNETGFKIERSNDGTTFTQIIAVGANVKAYQDTSVAANKRYYYRVRASNANGDSAYSNTANAKTPRR